MRLRAVVQVLACSGVPTQLLLIQVLALLGVRPFVEGEALNATWRVDSRCFPGVAPRTH